MKRYGKTKLSILFILLAVLAYTAYLVIPAKAATSVDNTRFSFAITRALIAQTSDGAIVVDDVYVIFYDRDTGYMAISQEQATSDPNYTAGATAVDNSWANCAVAGASQATADTASSGTNTMVFVCDPPPLDDTKKWGMMVFENGTPANTDIPIICVKYDVNANESYTDTNPILENRVRTLER